MAIELDNSFTVPVPPKQAWDVLLDVERIAPCMPGATVTGVDGDEITGTVKVKLGPVSLTYKGTARFTEKDEERRSVSLEANGKETRGSGTASATVQASLAPGESDGETAVTMHTSLNVTGRPAQFGRGVMADVSAKLVEQFATNLSALLAQSVPAEPADSTEAAEVTEPADAVADAVESTTDDAQPESTATPAAPQQQDSLNVMRLVAGPVLKRIIPVAAVAAAITLLYRKVLRRSKA
jgi:carbon monoxide dehydrogenase subunit G